MTPLHPDVGFGLAWVLEVGQVKQQNLVRSLPGSLRASSFSQYDDI